MSNIKSTKGDSRLRNYATIVYPESAKENWLDILSEFHVPCFVSPLHDKDFNPHGEPKKPHYHVQFEFEGKKSVEQVMEIINAIGGVGCEPVVSLRGYARYLCHLDNPEKAQYDTDKVRCFAGADYVSAIGLPTDKYKAIQEMKDWCAANHCVSFSDLFDYAADNHFDWFRVLCDNGTYVIEKYLKSKSWTIEYSRTHKVFHNDTGEIVDVPKGFDALNDDSIEF